MKKLYVMCEGKTEAGFCSDLLQVAVFPNRDGEVMPITFITSEKRGEVFRGGIKSYESCKRQIGNILNSIRGNETYVTSMIDLYRLPNTFPSLTTANKLPGQAKAYVEILEQAFQDDIADHRFIAHIQLHEYETLLFAQVEKFGEFFENCEKQIQSLHSVVTKFGNIELINDNYETCPSRRIIQEFPKYTKSTTCGLNWNAKLARKVFPF